MARTKTLDKQNEILEAAASVFAARDFHEVRIDEIAAAAGVGKGTIYRYFETKEDLYFATITEGWDALNDRLAAALPAETSPSRRLERIAREALAFFWDRRALLTLLRSDERRFPHWDAELQKRRDVLGKLVERAITEGILAGEFRPIDPRIGAELFRGMLRAANCWRRPEDTIEQLVCEIVGIFRHGIERRPA
jgi:AcrR family transcriptional regulator